MPKTETPLDAEHLIRQSGLKCTRSRLQVLDMLLCQREVLSADEIYEKLLQTGARLNFSTVYTGAWKLSQKRNSQKKSCCPRAGNTASCCTPSAIPIT